MKCPPLLHPEYSGNANSKAKQAVAHAYEAVHDILISKDRTHPITEIFSNYMQRLLSQPKERFVDLKTRIMGFVDEFWFPIFPGDSSTFSSALVKLEGDARSLDPSNQELHAAVAAQATVLFNVVLVRVALGSSGLHDLEIFYLGYRGPWRSQKTGELTIAQETALLGSLARAPTPFEEAILASLGASNTTVSDHQGLTPGFGRPTRTRPVA
ncbi:hypothetical protein CC2G_002983 [Coprinopsis cinerea AmutBmut pab1-1]|nr:hypothetical protein CC2G_002983 [Coprinopsis cinerea AmutBmut pab1-1]